MRKYNITVNGKTYEVEVEEVGGSLMGRGHIRPASAPAAAASAAAPEAARPAPAQTAQTQTAVASTPAQLPQAEKILHPVLRERYLRSQLPPDRQ